MVINKLSIQPLIFANVPNNDHYTTEVSVRHVSKISISISPKGIVLHVQMEKYTTIKPSLVNAHQISKLFIKDVHVHLINLFIQKISHAFSVYILISTILLQWNVKHVLMGTGIKSVLEVAKKSFAQEIWFTTIIIKYVHVQISSLIWFSQLYVHNALSDKFWIKQISVKNADKVKLTTLQQENVNAIRKKVIFGINKRVLNVCIRDTLIMLIRSANNVLKINYFLFRLKCANIVLNRSHILMDSFVILVQIINIGKISLIHVKIALIMRFINLNLRSAYVLLITTETNLRTVLNVFLQCMSINLHKYASAVLKV